MHLQENTLFYIKTREMLPCTLATHVLAKLEVVTSSSGLGGDAFTKILDLTFYLDLGKVTRNIAQYHLHHPTYAPAKFDFATSWNSLGGYAFTSFVMGEQTDNRLTLVRT